MFLFFVKEIYYEFSTRKLKKNNYQEISLFQDVYIDHANKQIK